MDVYSSGSKGTICIIALINVHYLCTKQRLRLCLCNTKERIRKQKIDIMLDNVSLERVNSTKFLNVIIDENLTWKNHTGAIFKTISTNICMLTKMKHYAPEYILY